ncbi:MAG: undecaprenyldiphospho-muramoylpentapeptide beta-N-acetylglucosaminyltransferase [Treponema sp.]|jgi:UDP-N-acetylglucosamine--N-acetylmuramyl-(pentapeptide) pyrophosphoryl-undecaprenol N-acetylglucosamine transferase|nr:undecaprenyldiphospho-muramoylpentapeptide beta-N-acetylglucosaminyltransferase [Treponema sp.]
MDMVGIAFTGGGTGGHIYPGLALARYIQELYPCRFFWIGSSRGMDREIVEKAGFPFFGVPSGKLRRYFSIKNLSDFFRVAAGFFAARKLLKREKPALLFSKGGFVSVPPCAAAVSLRIPVFTHESDFSPGLATRINARFAERIFTAYAQTAEFFPPALRGRIRKTGNPVRASFRAAAAARGRAFLGLGEERILLVLGGSQGAREVNELVRAALPLLTRYYTVVHQTGVREQGASPSGSYRPYPYIAEEMPHVIAAAELVLGRSGAGTLWECATLGKPMVLLPLAGAGTRGDQVENARFFEQAGAALVLMPPVRPETLGALVGSLAEDGERRNAMAAASVKIGEADGAGQIARELVSFLKERQCV